MTAGRFNKTTKKKQAKRARPKAPLLPPRKPAKPGDAKSPVTRVGPGLEHHDTIATKVYYVLADDPKAPQDSVVLEHPPQTFPMAFTTDAQPLSTSILTFELAFEPVADGGKLTLKLERGGSRTEVELFTDVPEKDVMLSDADLTIALSGDQDPAFNLRTLDYTTIRPRPPYDDATLDQKGAPHSSLGRKD
jgi:hypothetical protein